LIGVSKEGDSLLLVLEFVDRGELYKVRMHLVTTRVFDAVMCLAML
jgi:hypothetical protein